MQPTAVVITALPIEHKAVVSHLEHLEEVEHDSGTIYQVGSFSSPKCVWRVAVAQVGMGNERSSLELERAIRYFSPAYAFFTGVAGGIKDVKIGDVVAASKVYGYEAGKAKGELLPRADFGESAYALIQRAQAVANQGSWHDRFTDQSRSGNSKFKAFVGPIAAGSKVIASRDAPTYRFLKKNFSDALAVEMEGYGFFRAAHANHSVKALVVRGISDLIEGKSEADASGSQELASCHAAVFTFEVLGALSPPSGSRPPLQKGGPEENLWQDFPAVAEELYPGGPSADGVWERAGGNLATLNLRGSGRSVWHSAARKLQRGGGGRDITLKSLLDTMLKDYPGNALLSRMRRQAA